MRRPKTNSLPIPEISRADRLRFWAKVERCGDDECWPWIGAVSGKGYGRFKMGPRLYSTHRIAYELETGTIPRMKDGFPAEIMHSCDNPPCCNPRHLSVGTRSENMIDMAQKGRGPSEHTRGVFTCLDGISGDKLSEMRASPLGNIAAAEFFGVSQRAIRRARGRPV